MNEANVRREIFNLLRRLWYTPHRLKDTVICPTCKTRILPQTGRPDILANSAYGPGIYVEVKALNLQTHKSFAFNRVTPEQHRYLDRRTEEGFKCFLALGTVGVKRGQRRLWLTSWPYWKGLEGWIRPGRKSIPYNSNRTSLDLAHCFATEELSWASGCWHLYRYHLAWQAGAPKGERDLDNIGTD